MADKEFKRTVVFSWKEGDKPAIINELEALVDSEVVIAQSVEDEILRVEKLEALLDEARIDYSDV